MPASSEPVILISADLFKGVKSFRLLPGRVNAQHQEHRNFPKAV
jgi:hypothetical protein